MTLPASRDFTAFDGVSQLPAATLNRIQDSIVAGWQSGGLIYGDGSDGIITLDGTVAAPIGMTKVGTVYTLTRDFFADTLTVTGATTQLKLGGFRLFVRNTLTTSGGASVNSDGTAGSTNVGGTAPAAGTVHASASQAGATASNTSDSVGIAAAAVTNSFGGAGGAGGAVSLPNPRAGGVGGTVAVPTGNGSLRLVSVPHLGYFVALAAGAVSHTPYVGGGGGGGGAAGTAAGTSSGGGGAGAGVAIICARVLNLASVGDIRANGGAGAAATVSGGQQGGGGGGGGGVLILIYASSNLTGFSAATNAAGGAGGASAGGGGAGVAGSSGTCLALQVQVQP
jgi:hypothetical protein